MNFLGDAPPSKLNRAYRYMRLEWHAEFSVLIARIGVKPIQCYSLAAMAELHQIFSDITANPGLVKHFVTASDGTGLVHTAVDEVPADEKPAKSRRVKAG